MLPTKICVRDRDAPELCEPAKTFAWAIILRRTQKNFELEGGDLSRDDDDDDDVS